MTNFPIYVPKRFPEETWDNYKARRLQSKQLVRKARLVGTNKDPIAHVRNRSNMNWLSNHKDAN